MQIDDVNRSAAFYRSGNRAERAGRVNCSACNGARLGVSRRSAGVLAYNRPAAGAPAAFAANGESGPVGSISQQNPVRVFVSHAFEASDDYHRVFEYLESAHNFYYRNCSDPQLHAALDRDAMKDELRRQISLAEVVVVPAALYGSCREWIDFQLNCAKGLDKPVIVLEWFGVKQKMPVQLEALGDEIVEWDERQITDAIRRQARHEDTTRWDTIDFKLD